MRLAPGWPSRRTVRLADRGCTISLSPTLRATTSVACGLHSADIHFITNGDSSASNLSGPLSLLGLLGSLSLLSPSRLRFLNPIDPKDSTNPKDSIDSVGCRLFMPPGRRAATCPV